MVGVDFTSKQLKFPEEIEELKLYNIRVDDSFQERLGGLKKLKKLTLVGCWVDENISMPALGNRYMKSINEGARAERWEKALNPFKGIHETLQTVEFIDCDRKITMLLTYYEWPKLTDLAVSRSQEYPSHDGVMHDMIFLRFSVPSQQKTVNVFRTLEKISYYSPDYGGRMFDVEKDHIEIFLKSFEEGH